MSTNKTYNGWTNYATWRINLEIFDCDEFLADLVKECKDVYDFSERLENYVNELFDDQPQTIYRSYADAFISDVNWYEIAEHYTELLFNADEK